MSKKKQVAEQVADNSSMPQDAVEAKPLDVKQYPNRIFILVEKLKAKRATDVAYACKLLSDDEVATAHLRYKGEQYELVAIPDIYRQAATNDAYKCMDYIGFFEHGGVMPSDGRY